MDKSSTELFRIQIVAQGRACHLNPLGRGAPLSYFGCMADAKLTAWKRLLDTPEPPALGPTRRSGTLSETELAGALNLLFAQAMLSTTNGASIHTVPNGELIHALLLLWHDHLDASHTISQ